MKLKLGVHEIDMDKIVRVKKKGLQYRSNNFDNWRGSQSCLQLLCQRLSDLFITLYLCFFIIGLMLIGNANLKAKSHEKFKVATASTCLYH